MKTAAKDKSHTYAKWALPRSCAKTIHAYDNCDVGSSSICGQAHLEHSAKIGLIVARGYKVCKTCESMLDGSCGHTKTVPASLDLVALLKVQIPWSEKIFGPGDRTVGVTEHIACELQEIRESQGKPEVLEEWVDVILLGLDGAWRSGHTAEEVCVAIEAKSTKNRARKWNNVNTDPDKPIFHVKG